MEPDGQNTWRVVIEFAPADASSSSTERHVRPWGMRLVATDPSGTETTRLEEQQPEPLSLIAHAVAEVADTVVAIQRHIDTEPA